MYSQPVVCQYPITVCFKGQVGGKQVKLPRSAVPSCFVFKSNHRICLSVKVPINPEVFWFELTLQYYHPLFCS